MILRRRLLVCYLTSRHPHDNHEGEWQPRARKLTRWFLPFMYITGKPIGGAPMLQRIRAGEIAKIMELYGKLDPEVVADLRERISEAIKQEVLESLRSVGNSVYVVCGSPDKELYEDKEPRAAIQAAGKVISERIRQRMDLYDPRPSDPETSEAK
jgi:hypothetical protein